MRVLVENEQHTDGTFEVDTAFDALISGVILGTPPMSIEVTKITEGIDNDDNINDDNISDDNISDISIDNINIDNINIDNIGDSGTVSGNVIGGADDDEIDPALTAGDMMTLIYAEIEKKRIAGHHIDSMNSFNRVGIKQIVTKVFVIEGRMKNVRDKTPEDKEILEIQYKVEFTDIKLTPPTTMKYKSGAVQMLTPNMARIKNLTYSAQMYISAKITAVAHFKNGTSKTRTAEFKDHRIASIPCAVGTELCNTYGCSKETLKSLEEDPRNPGGYFIIKGTEWCVDNLENITNNTFHVYNNMYMNEISRGTFLSKPGDAFENSYQVILRYLNSGNITIEITTNKFDKFEIPYYLIFRALGMSRDRDIINNIVYGVDNTDPVTVTMLEILERAFEADDPIFGPIRKSTNPTEIIQFIAQKIMENANTAMAKKDDNIAKYLNSNILNIIDRYIFPHIGTEIEHRIKKLRFFGHLINKLLSVNIGITEPTDRDSYKNKRVHSAGTSMAKAFKTDFNFAAAMGIRKHLAQDFKSTPFSQVQLADSVKLAINGDDLERMLIQAITTGNKTITVRRNEVTNRVSSQMMYHKNDLNVKSTLGTINTSNTTANKQNERADEMRRVHPTYLGYIDISQSADTGEKVGMTKQMACTASVCGASSSFLLKSILRGDKEIMDLDDVPPEQISAQKLAKVFVNGEWIGCCKHAHEIASKYRNERRHGKIHSLTTIVWEPLLREIYFWTDVGRLMRPLLIVYNNITEYIDNWRNGDRSVVFKQWIRLKSEHIRGLQKHEIDMDHLLREGIIEYISPEEQENAYLAPNIGILREHKSDLTHMYTHCDIDQAIFGIVTLAAPLANHSNAVRNTMYTNHRKQSAGWFALNYPFRIDKNVTLQHYGERPIVSTFSDSLTSPNGQNTIVALACHGGQNQEDSVTTNQSSIDCGAFNASFYSYEKAELEKGEQFGNPDYARTMDIKKDAVYDYVKGEAIAEGTLAQKGHVLIVKTAKIPKPIDQYLYVDRSIVYKREEPAYVERVITTRNDEDALITKVKLRSDRPMEVGDKFCLTDSHDVLTIDGWKPINEVKVGDIVATLVGKRIKYDRVSDTQYYRCSGDSMYVVRAKDGSVILETTMEHRMYASADGVNFGLITANDICSAACMWYTGSHTGAYGHISTGSNIGSYPEYIGTDQWPVILGMFLLYGKPGISGGVLFNNVSVGHLQSLGDALDELGCSYNCTHNDIVVNDPNIYTHLCDISGLPEYVYNYCSRRSTILRDIISDCEWISKADIDKLNAHCGNAIIGVGEEYPSYWGNVYCITVPSGVFMTRRLNGPPLWTGNSSRSGNKGICSIKIPRCDMPYCEDGLVPDIIVNSHSIPTRMAVNQIIECLLGIYGVRKGQHIDATSFREHDIGAVIEALKEYGIDYGGHRRMYNGKTGDWIDTLIFIGPTTYQRLQKYVMDEHYATRTGPTSALTRQPLDGKNVGGGLRLGEMEKDVLCGHGVMRTLSDKMYKDSDGVNVPICRGCGNRAVVNEKLGIYKCKYCGDMADIVSVNSAWAANLFWHEASSMNIKMTMELEPQVYSRRDESP